MCSLVCGVGACGQSNPILVGKPPEVKWLICHEKCHHDAQEADEESLLGDVGTLGRGRRSGRGVVWKDGDLVHGCHSMKLLPWAVDGGVIEMEFGRGAM